MGEEEGGERQIGVQTARRAFISTEGTENKRGGACSASGKFKRKFDERGKFLNSSSVLDMSMPMCNPGQRLSEEQDYVRAYENVREKYKGNDTPCFSLVAFNVHTRMITMSCLNERFLV